VRDARVVDQDVEPAKLIGNFGNHRPHLFVTLNVRLNRQGSYSGALDFTCEVLSFLARLAIVDRDCADAGLGQASHYGAADATGAAGY
jgi:hypothetical protein